ncbi:restriction endonuclease subunit S [Kushneria phyllosphaerae]|uniref:Type-1 restriction enzyme EcoKI specificity protein n=1 Tax=Kushneria phyllosphaerae TaxID=2100822 RepID=A0A2R8CHP0_9GAMM|nr:restriction endonuclease subunit S [Kushneria phyllosphaerae]SPJ32411.1 Type-1 restriction enzyme EcoKI specificity protein [Kushneria phyllosphaerae]
MAHYEMPVGWLRVKFTDVLDIQGGTQPPKAEFISDSKNGYVRLLQIRDFGKKPVPTYVPDTSKLKKCNKDDLLIGRYGASLGRICTGMDGAYNVALAKVVVPLSINKFFLKSYLESGFFQNGLRLLSRSAQNGFNKGDLEEFDFFLPPLAEQKVIAEKLDTLLAQVDNTKARLERIPEILKRFHQSVLAAAVSGRLTKSVAMSEKPINDLSTVIGGLTKNAKRAELSIKKPYLRVANVYENELRLDDIQKIGIKESELSKGLLQTGDLLIVEGNGSIDQIGRVALWQGEIKECMHQNHLIKVRLNKQILHPRFALFFLMSPVGKERIVEKATSGAGLYTLSISKVSAIKVPIFNLEEQTEIVRRVDQLFAYADTVERQVNSALERVNQLTQSILAKAFRGELTAQWRADNPELISGDNSAEALLERIKAERAAQAPTKRTRKKASA